MNNLTLHVFLQKFPYIFTYEDLETLVRYIYAHSNKVNRYPEMIQTPAFVSIYIHLDPDTKYRLVKFIDESFSGQDGSEPHEAQHNILRYLTMQPYNLVFTLTTINRMMDPETEVDYEDEETLDRLIQNLRVGQVNNAIQSVSNSAVKTYQPQVNWDAVVSYLEDEVGSVELDGLEGE